MSALLQWRNLKFATERTNNGHVSYSIGPEVCGDRAIATGSWNEARARLCREVLPLSDYRPDL